MVILLEQEFSKFEDSSASDTQNIDRPDLLREFREGENDIINVPCSSLAKLKWMQIRLENSGFTSFWP